MCASLFNYLKNSSLIRAAGLVRVIKGSHEGAFGALRWSQAGTRCTSPEEVEMIETIVDMDEKWDKTLATKAEWLKVPELPLGSRRGDYVRIMTVAARKGMNLEEVRYPEDIPKILGDQWDVEEQEPPSPPRGTQVSPPKYIFFLPAVFSLLLRSLRPPSRRCLVE
jgi:hypothetical protein